MPSAPKIHKSKWAPTKKQQRADYEARRARTPALAEAARLRGSAAWRKYVAWFKSEHPLCCNPFRKEHHLRPTEDVHHIITLSERPDLLCVSSNTVPLCRQCHAAISAMERSGRREEAIALFDAGGMSV